MSFATRLATALAEVNPGFSTPATAALTTFQASLDAEMVTYGASASTRAWADDQILAIGLLLADGLHGAGGPTGGTPLILEGGDQLLLETSDPLLLESQ